MDDLFGHTPSTPSQGGLFEEPEAPPPKQLTAEDIKAEMLALLAKARTAETMPWTPREVRSHTVMFPEMAKWLPQEEGEHLLLEFETEMERLRNAA